MSEKNDYIIEMHGIQKSFGGVKALRNIDLQVKRGSCHALLGENGAGKSTLMKVLTGIIAKDSGKILLNGEEVQIQSLRHAEELGIAIVPQELSFISYFTVAENIFYGEEPTRPLPLLDESIIRNVTGELGPSAWRVKRGSVKKKLNASTLSRELAAPYRCPLVLTAVTNTPRM